ncbi:sigma-70 family RNA polymerase sigma factor [Halosquirtibacter laminarini]|uniref:Sigma-70 family RNA polymerase sigma factor n=1 Tax=Halosquirtibacter laminarini TaxID=3374600 RepID=A0AC61NF17_9BACT|nr:sigma-70 family RNA polymerase sigma factor [Prolixibacteraceae bacterium]
MEIKRLIKKCLGNDQRAFNKLYKKNSPIFAGICKRYASSEDEANEILQEAFIKIFQNLDKLKDQSLFEAWGKRIVINTALSTIKQKNNNISIDEKEIDITEEEEEESNQILEHLDISGIISLMNKLPKGYKTIINLYAMESYSHKEIGEMLDIKESTSRSQYHKAKKAFQKIILQNITENK